MSESDKNCRQLVIEAMSESDLPDVVAIEEASFSDPWKLESFQTELNFNSLAIYLVARLEGRVIAYIGSWLILDEVHITTLAVREDFRCRGIAGRLLNTLVDLTVPKGAALLTLEVRPSNTGARSFYEKYGFRELGRRKRYYRDEDALIMTCSDLSLFKGKDQDNGQDRAPS